MDELIAIAHHKADLLITSFDIRAALALLAAALFFAAGYFVGRQSGRKAEVELHAHESAQDESMIIRELPGMVIGAMCRRCGAGKLDHDESVRLVVCSNVDCSRNAPQGFVKSG